VLLSLVTLRRDSVGGQAILRNNQHDASVIAKGLCLSTEVYSCIDTAMSRPRPPLDAALRPIVSAIDRSSPIPVSVQLRGALEFGIATAELPEGMRLPSVRALARMFGLSPVTVAGVYATLRDAGLIESRVGAGSFVAPGRIDMAPELGKHRELQARIAELIHIGSELGLSPAELGARVASGVGSPASHGLRIAVLSHFTGATESYARALEAHAGASDSVFAATFEALKAQAGLDADLIVTPRNLVSDAASACPDLPVVGLTFIPDEATRVGLAALPPEARVLAVSYFPHFLPLMKAGLQRFAAHVLEMQVLVRDDPELDAALTSADVLIYASGAHYLIDSLSAGQTALEYLHTPDPRSVRDDFLPALNARRAELMTQRGESDAHKRLQLV
jgi:GntR family transcriptional regulator